MVKSAVLYLSSLSVLSLESLVWSKEGYLGHGDVGHGQDRLHALVADPGDVDLDPVTLVIVDHPLVVIPGVINIIGIKTM